MGSRICIFWPTERNWFSGHVAAFDDSEGLSKIEYDDGDTEWLHLAVECYMQPPTGGILHAQQTLSTLVSVVLSVLLGWMTNALVTALNNSCF